jgi:hypothetical protein
MQSDSKQRALRSLRRRSVIAGVPIGCLLLAAAYSVSLGLPRLGFSSTQDFFTYDNDNWIRQRIGCFWNYSVLDPGPGPDLSRNPVPSLFTRIGWQLDRKLSWNSVVPNDLLDGTALGICGPSLVAYRVLTFDGQSFAPTKIVASQPWRVAGTVIPIRPTLSLAADVLLFSGVAALVCFGIGYARLARRERAGLCLACGYPSPGSICSECGDGAVTTSASSV